MRNSLLVDHRRTDAGHVEGGNSVAPEESIVSGTVIAAVVLRVVMMMIDQGLHQKSHFGRIRRGQKALMGLEQKGYLFPCHPHVGLVRRRLPQQQDRDLEVV